LSTVFWLSLRYRVHWLLPGHCVTSFFNKTGDPPDGNGLGSARFCPEMGYSLTAPNAGAMMIALPAKAQLLLHA
jgi:hypothetical protein